MAAAQARGATLREIASRLALIEGADHPLSRRQLITSAQRYRETVERLGLVAPAVPDGYALEAAAVARRVLRDRQSIVVTLDDALLTLAGARGDERLTLAGARHGRRAVERVRALGQREADTSWLPSEAPQLWATRLVAMRQKAIREAASAHDRFAAMVDPDRTGEIPAPLSPEAAKEEELAALLRDQAKELAAEEMRASRGRGPRAKWEHEYLLPEDPED